MKELLAKQGLNKENSHNCSHQNGQVWNGNPNDQHEVIKEVKVDIMLQDKYSVITAKVMDIWPKRARTKGYLRGGGQQIPAPPIQGLNAYAQNFVPMQYPLSIPQSVVSQQVPQYVQSNMVPVQQTRLPTVPISQGGQGMVPAAPAQ